MTKSATSKGVGDYIFTFGHVPSWASSKLIPSLFRRRAVLSADELLRLFGLEYLERVGFLDLRKKGSIVLCELRVLQNLKRV